MENNYCKKCGDRLNGNASFCISCGASTNNNPNVQQPARVPVPPRPNNQYSYVTDTYRLYKLSRLDSSASMALWMVVISFLGGSFFTAIPAFIMSGKVLDEDPYNSNAGMARKLSVVSIVLNVVLLIVAVIIISNQGKH